MRSFLVLPKTLLRMVSSATDDCAGVDGHVAPCTAVAAKQNRKVGTSRLTPFVTSSPGRTFEQPLLAKLAKVKLGSNPLRALTSNDCAVLDDT